MDGKKVTFTKNGVRVEEEREAPLSNEKRVVTLDELAWDEFPAEGLTMEIEDIEPIPSEYDDKALTGLRFQVADLNRTDGSSDQSTEEFWTQVKDETGIMREDDEILLSGDASAKANLIHFVDFLLEQGYLTRNDLPIDSGWKRHLINTKPEHKNGDAMAQSVAVRDEVHVETKYSRDAIKKKIKELADRFGEDNTT